jgi:excisionase family DNA binding protein
MQEEMTTHEAAAALGISRQRVLELAKAGRLGRKVEGLMPYYVFTREEIERYKSSPRRGGRPPKAVAGARPA